MGTFEVQGHRGARGLAPENTLAGFELALDCGVSSIETDVVLSSDDVPILFHDLQISERICSSIVEGTAAAPSTMPTVRSLRLEQLREYRIVRDPACLDTPLVERFSARHKIHPLGILTLSDLFAFVAYYASPTGTEMGKSMVQQDCARGVIFDIELKSVPFLSGSRGQRVADLEHAVVNAIRSSGMIEHARVRSFDHRSMLAMKKMEPRLVTGVLVHHSVPADPGLLLESAWADLYCPDYFFVDETLVRAVHAVGKRIIPYTVNAAEEWEQLVAWNVDGITTDFPDRLWSWLRERNLAAR